MVGKLVIKDSSVKGEMWRNMENGHNRFAYVWKATRLKLRRAVVFCAFQVDQISHRFGNVGGISKGI